MRRALAGDGFFRFTLIREPMVRFVSGYIEKMTRDTPHRDRFLKHHYPDREPGDEISVELFLTALENAESFKVFDKHWRPQSELLFQPDQSFDFVGTVEALEDGWSALEQQIPAFAEAPRENVLWHATSADSRIDEVLTPDQRRRVEALFAADFELYERHRAG